MPLTNAIQPFPASRLPDFPVNSDLDNAVKKIAEQNQFSKLGIALIDLTPPIPLVGAPYGGVNDLGNFYIASCAKLAALYAACQLLQAVSDALIGSARATGETGTSIAAQVSQQLATLPASPYWNGFPRDTPKIANILDITADPAGPGWRVQFVNSGKPWSEVEKLHLKPLNQIRPLGFWERLELMIGPSDNCGAMTCIQDLGFQYINGLLATAGLFDTKAKAGLWLGAAYSTGCNGTSSTWSPVPGTKPVSETKLGQPKKYDGNSYQVSNARALAKVMGLVDERKLVSGQGSLTMLNLMNKSTELGNSTFSPFLDGLQNLKYTGLVGFSKLGMNGLNSDAAIIQRKLGTGADIRYVAVGLGEAGSLNGALLSKLGTQLDACIASRH
jgi:hypothetical protein